MQYLIDTDKQKIKKTKTNYYSYKYTKLSKKRGKLAYREIGVKPKTLKKIKTREKRKYKNRVPRKYGLYIISKYWEKRKNEYWQKYDKRCAVCGSSKFVHLHHMRYEANQYGKEPDEWLVPMCQFHHNEFHEQNKIKSDLTAETLKYIEDNYIHHERKGI